MNANLRTSPVDICEAIQSNATNPKSNKECVIQKPTLLERVVHIQHGQMVTIDMSEAHFRFIGAFP